MVSQSDDKLFSFSKVYLAWNPSDPTSDNRIAVNEATKRLSEKAKICETLHTCPYPGRLAYIHAHPFLIVGIDIIASDDGGHRDRGRGGGEEQAWIVEEGEYKVRTKRYVR